LSNTTTPHAQDYLLKRLRGAADTGILHTGFEEVVGELRVLSGLDFVGDSPMHPAISAVRRLLGLRPQQQHK
jgi:hypothetical protein